MTKIHPTAIVHEDSKIGNNVTIGAFCIIGQHVTIGDGCTLHSNVLIEGRTTIGENNTFYHSAVVGSQPQDLKYSGEPTKLVIGDNNSIREFTTINLSATMDEDTVIGNNNLLMAYVHVAHNCQIGNNIILANACMLAGHIHINDFASIGGMVAIHQFVHIGGYTFVGGKSGIKKDVPPFTRGEGFPYRVKGLNSVGLQRKGFSIEAINSLKQVYKLFYRSELNVTQAMTQAEAIIDLTDEQKVFLDFIRKSPRGISR